jgi:hypothetical protein
MSNERMPDSRVRFAKSLRETDTEHSKRVSAHFEAQADLFAQCRCGERLTGTLAQIKAHVCPIFGSVQ